MTVAIGTRTCAVLTCHRARHSSANGQVRYSHCLAHSLQRVSAAFSDDPHEGARAGVYPRALGPRPLAVAVPAHRPAA